MTGTLEWIVLVAAAITAIGIIWAAARKVRTVYKSFKGKAEQAFDAINGREEVLHPETGAVLLPSAPGIVNRVAKMEEAQTTMASTMAALAEANNRLANLEEQMTEGFEEVRNDKESQHAELWKAISEIKGD